MYEIQKWIRGWGWITIYRAGVQEQAEHICKCMRADGFRMRVKAVEDIK